MRNFSITLQLTINYMTFYLQSMMILQVLSALEIIFIVYLYKLAKSQVHFSLRECDCLVWKKERKNNIKANFNSHSLPPYNDAALFLLCDQTCFYGYAEMLVCHLQFLSHSFLYPVSLNRSVVQVRLSSGNGICSKYLPLFSAFMSSLVKHTSCHCLSVITSQCNTISKQILRISWWYKMENDSNRVLENDNITAAIALPECYGEKGFRKIHLAENRVFLCDTEGQDVWYWVLGWTGIL